MCEVKYWVWLSLCLGAGAKIKELLDYFSTPKKIYESDIFDYHDSDLISEAKLDSIAKYSLEDACRIIDVCEQNGWDIIAYDDTRYPNILKDISNPPAVLYVNGEMPDFDNALTIAVVGTRKASPYAKKAAEVISKELAESGAIIVSGGALGIDSAAHLGAIKAKGKTVAVLGCGLASNYLKTNKELREQIINSGGAVISEFAPSVGAGKHTFPIRNRIISGLSRGVLVAESANKGGSLITAECAKKQGRDVFAIPGSIFDNAFCGNNNLIDEGAYVVTGAHSVLKHYAFDYPELNPAAPETVYNLPSDRQYTFDNIVSERKAENERQEQALTLSESERKVYYALSDEYINIEVLQSETGLPSSMLMAMLSLLESKGLAENKGSVLFRKK